MTEAEERDGTGERPGNPLQRARGRRKERVEQRKAAKAEARAAAANERARRIAVAMEEESAPERWLRTLRFSGFTAVALGLLVLAVVILAPSLRVLVDQQQQIQALERTVKAQRDQVAGLQAELSRWSDPAYIEAQARERLLFVYPGEFSYLVVGASGTETDAPSDDPISADLQSTDVDWLAALLASTYGAGLTEASADELSVVGEGQG